MWDFIFLSFFLSFSPSFLSLINLLFADAFKAFHHNTFARGAPTHTWVSLIHSRDHILLCNLLWRAFRMTCSAAPASHTQVLSADALVSCITSPGMNFWRELWLLIHDLVNCNCCLYKSMWLAHSLTFPIDSVQIETRRQCVDCVCAVSQLESDSGSGSPHRPDFTWTRIKGCDTEISFYTWSKFHFCCCLFFFLSRTREGRQNKPELYFSGKARFESSSTAMSIPSVMHRVWTTTTGTEFKQESPWKDTVPNVLLSLFLFHFGSTGFGVTFTQNRCSVAAAAWAVLSHCDAPLCSKGWRATL